MGSPMGSVSRELPFMRKTTVFVSSRQLLKSSDLTNEEIAERRLLRTPPPLIEEPAPAAAKASEAEARAPAVVEVRRKASAAASRRESIESRDEQGGEEKAAEESAAPPSEGSGAKATPRPRASAEAKAKEPTDAPPTYPDAQLCLMAETLCIRSPKRGEWLSQLEMLIEQLPQAVAVSDGTAENERYLLCNAAAAALTGYSREEMVGQRTNLLQCAATEAAAVRRMKRSVRACEKTTLFVTNRRKDDSLFRSVLTLHPVKDDSGALCYWIALMADAERLADERGAYDFLRSLLPTEWSDTSKRAKEADELDRMAWKESMLKFTKLLWSMNWEASLTQVLQHPSSKAAFGQWLREVAPAEGEKLQLCLQVARLDELAEEAAAKLAKAMSSDPSQPAEAALAEVRAKAREQMAYFAEKRFAKFASSKSSSAAVENILASSKTNIDLVASLLLPKYEVAKDVAPWLRGFISAAETFPVCVAMSDQLVTGNQLIYVNKEFCKVTGYSRDEVLGRSCRFLQGPRTERPSVMVIEKTLKKGVDSQVKITNYSKKGRPFQNLLTLKPMHDSNGAYRFVVSLWLDVTEETNLETKSSRLIKLIKLLPSPLDVPKPSEDDAKVDDKANEKVAWWKGSLAKVTARLWNMDCEQTLRNVMSDPLAFKCFRLWLKKAAPDDVLQLDICQEAASLKTKPARAALAHAAAMCRQYLADNVDGQKALTSITEYSEQALQVLAERRFVKFAAGKAGTDTIDKLLERPVEEVKHLVWHGFQAAPDYMLDWMLAFVSVAGTFPMALAITDVTIPGNPLLFVNSEFTRITGYSRQEALGKNCKFLQGEDTEPGAVNKIRQALDDQSSCQVRLLNYRKDGRAFDNLLSIRPMLDAQENVRFFFSIQVDVTGMSTTVVAAHASRATKLLKIIPQSLS
ncbi:hypothetical protein AB1Y20_008917 [Prymnesium parvum]|uniref:LOV domain-containing protein n=1 Tax=Prymnesium parvum TaxID=97485 RepID=A0AB34K2C3_PRYPA